MKDFDRWNKIKKETNESDRRVYFKERQIWWCKMGLNIGHEEDGKGKEFMRPVLVLKQYGQDTFLGLPLTKQIFVHKHRIRLVGIRAIEDSDVILSQARIFDRRRLVRKMIDIPKSEFIKIKNKFKQFL